MTLPLLLTRNYSGFGDWLMSLAVMKMVERQRPDVQIHVSFSTPREPLQSLVPESFAASDLKFKLGAPAPGAMHLATRHFVYRSSRLPFIPDMVSVLNERTGLDIAYEPGVYPTFRYPAPRARGYVALISHGKAGPVASGKEWGADNFARLAELLAGSVELVQVGAASDRPLPGVQRHCLGESFTTVAQTLAGARLFVGVENGLMVLAGFLGRPQLTVYCGAGQPDRLTFANHIQVRDRASPEAVAEKVLAQC